MGFLRGLVWRRTRGGSVNAQGRIRRCGNELDLFRLKNPVEHLFGLGSQFGLEGGNVVSGVGAVEGLDEVFLSGKSYIYRVVSEYMYLF